jgi:hypothetical protein
VILYSSRRRQVFLYTPLDHIPAIARAYMRGNIAAWRWIRANATGLAAVMPSLAILLAIASYAIREG